jgi:hypothetical protein
VPFSLCYNGTDWGVAGATWRMETAAVLVLTHLPPTSPSQPLPFLLSPLLPSHQAASFRPLLSRLISYTESLRIRECSFLDLSVPFLSSFSLLDFVTTRFILPIANNMNSTRLQIFLE